MVLVFVKCFSISYHSFKCISCMAILSSLIVEDTQPSHFCRSLQKFFFSGRCSDKTSKCIGKILIFPTCSIRIYTALIKTPLMIYHIHCIIMVYNSFMLKILSKHPEKQKLWQYRKMCIPYLILRSLV